MGPGIGFILIVMAVGLLLISLFYSLLVFMLIKISNKIFTGINFSLKITTSFFIGSIVTIVYLTGFFFFPYLGSTTYSWLVAVLGLVFLFALYAYSLQKNCVLALEESNTNRKRWLFSLLIPFIALLLLYMFVLICRGFYS